MRSRSGESAVPVSATPGAVTSRSTAAPLGYPAATTCTSQIGWLRRHIGERYRYAGDFKDGSRRSPARRRANTPISTLSGRPLHSRLVPGLWTCSTNDAPALATPNGWHHVDVSGEPLYGERFRNVEPFYNGQARVEGFDGSLLVIDESGQTLLEVRGHSHSHLRALLSRDMVGRMANADYPCRRGTRRVFEVPARVGRGTVELRTRAGLHRGITRRQIHEGACMELGTSDGRTQKGNYRATGRGALLMQKSPPLSYADAARHWGKES